jgi:hypothetical protein
MAKGSTNPKPPLPPRGGGDDDLSFATSSLGVWTFNKTLEDSVAQNDFSPSTGSAKYKQFQHQDVILGRHTRSGLEFEEGKSYSVTPIYSYPDGATLSFWYYSPGPLGFTRHIETRELEPKFSPIIAKGSIIQENFTIIANVGFYLGEQAYSKTQNVIVVYMMGTSTNAIHVSIPYDAPGLHHVLFTYSDSNIVRIDIDGKKGIEQPSASGNFHTSLPLTINNFLPGETPYQTTQVGARIFDLIFTTGFAQNDEALKAIRYGHEHLTLQSLYDTRFVYFGMSYAQPSTVSVTNIFIDGGSVFAARSNGEIVKGTRAVWDKEYEYPDVNGLSLLNTSPIDTEKTLVWTSGGIKIRGVSIKI